MMNPRAKTALLLAFIAAVGGAVHAPCASMEATIRWTKYGVPHITAGSYEGAGFGYGYAFARDRVCLLADYVTTLRGERSKWHGAEGTAVVGFLPTSNLDADLFYRVQLSDAAVLSATHALSKESRGLARGYAAGFNRYVKEMPAGAHDKLCEDVPLPQMNETDVVRVMMAIGVIWKAFQIAPFASASAWRANPEAARLDASFGQPRTGAKSNARSGSYRTAASSHMTLERRYSSPLFSIGSNAWAYGADATRTASSIVVANPHSYWRGHWLSLHQMHLTIPGKLDVAGADFVGLPLPIIGFNRDVSWTLEAPATVTYFVLQALQVREGAPPTYLVDAKQRPIAVQRISVEIKQKDGKVTRKIFPIAYSELGPLYRLPAAPDRPAGWYAVTDAQDGNAKGLDQLLDAARSDSIASFTRAMATHRGVGAHFVAGDRHGDSLYIESGPLLDIDDASLASCRLVGDAVAFNVLDGGRSACSVRTLNRRPKLLRPEKFPTFVTRGIVQNTNDSYRFSIHGRHVQGYSILFGDPSADFNDLRLPMSHLRIAEMLSDGKVTEGESVDIIFDNRNYAAESWLDSILEACTDRGATPEAARGCIILGNWDRRNDPESRGALLFSTLWPRVANIDGLYARGFDSTRAFEGRALGTSDRVKAKIVEALTEAVKSLEALQLQGDEAWGQMLAVRSLKGKVPLHGGANGEGVLNSLAGVALGKDGFAAIGAGTDYVQRVRWESAQPIADVLLAHGQSDDPGSPHFSDQLELLSAKKLVRLPFTENELAREETEILHLKE